MASQISRFPSGLTYHFITGNRFVFFGRMTKEKEKTLKTGLNMGHQASILTSTLMEVCQ